MSWKKFKLVKHFYQIFFKIKRHNFYNKLGTILKNLNLNFSKTTKNLLKFTFLKKYSQELWEYENHEISWRNFLRNFFYYHFFNSNINLQFLDLSFPLQIAAIYWTIWNFIEKCFQFKTTKLFNFMLLKYWCQDDWIYM